MNHKKIIPIGLGAIMLITFLSGCFSPGAIDTEWWDHINPEGTAVRIWGQLAITQSHENWNEFFVWDTESHSDWQDYEHFEAADNYAGAGLYSLDITDLNRTTEYHYRAIGEYLKGENKISIGRDRTFIPGGPRIVTESVSYYDLNSATLEAQLNHLGGAATVDAFFRYGTDTDNLNQESTYEIMSTTGDVSISITGLTSNITYFYKAVAVNDADTWDGLIYEVTPGLPQAITRLTSDVGTDYAVLKGELAHTGGTPECDVWFAYSDKSQNNLNQKTAILTLNDTGNFEILLSDLPSGTTHWYRAVADNGVAQDKGEIYEITTGGFVDGVYIEPYCQPLESEEEYQPLTRQQIMQTVMNKIIERYPRLLRLLENKI